MRSLGVSPGGTDTWKSAIASLKGFALNSNCSSTPSHTSVTLSSALTCEGRSLKDGGPYGEALCLPLPPLSPPVPCIPDPTTMSVMPNSLYGGPAGTVLGSEMAP